MKIVITGASGMLGYDLWQVLSTEHILLYGVGRGDCPDFIAHDNWYKIDLTDAPTTYQMITKINPELVIHTAALTDVDACEIYPEKAYLINALATRNVALACQRFDASMLYFSTDYIFDGEKGTPYREDDLGNPINVYGKTKYNGEFYVRHLLNKFYIVRSAWLFGKRRKNFVSDITEKMVSTQQTNEPVNQQTIRVVADQIGSPTYTNDLAQAIKELIKTNLYGVYHLSNSGSCSRYELAKEIVNLVNPKVPRLEIVPISGKELEGHALRPKYSVLENYNWKIQGFKPLRTWKEALREYLLQV